MAQQKQKDASQALLSDGNDGANTATTMPSPPQQDVLSCNDDPVVGLQFTNGKIFYFYRSTLLKKSGYFAQQLSKGERKDDESGVPRDSLGQRVYFIERDGAIFEHYILLYILTNQPGQLPPFAKDKALWRSLRKEAEFFQLEGLSKLLYVTNVLSPTNVLGRGVLHHVGTNMGGTQWNPHALGTIKVVRQAQYISNISNDSSKQGATEGSSNSNVVVQYLPNYNVNVANHPPCLAVIGVSEKLVQGPPSSRNVCNLFSPCCRPDKKPKLIPTIIDLCSMTLRLVAYSLHKDAVASNKWKVQGSSDGVTWKQLETACGNDKQTTVTFSEKEIQMLKSGVSMVKVDITTVPAEPDPMEKVDIVLDQAETRRRKVFNMANPSTDFFRYFRIITMDSSNAPSISENEQHEDDENRVSTVSKPAFHEVGIELFGEIHEE